MKKPITIIVSATVCTICLLASLLWVLVRVYLSNAYPNMTEPLFVPVTISGVPDEERTVTFYRVDPIAHEGYEDQYELDLNDISEGWISYIDDEVCHMIIAYNDASYNYYNDPVSLTELISFSFPGGGQSIYYYSDSVPSEYVEIKYTWDAKKVEKNGTLNPSTKFYSDSIGSSMFGYYTKIGSIVTAIIFNIAVIGVAAIINVVVGRSVKKKAKN